MSDFDDLLEAWQEGELDQAQEDALVAMLLEDESKRLAVLERGLLQAEVQAQRHHQRQDSARLPSARNQRPSRRLPKRRVRSGRRRRPASAPAAVIGIVAVVLVVMVVGVMANHTSDQPAATTMLTAVRGAVQVDGAASAVGTVVNHGAIVTVADHASAQITTVDGSTLDIAANSRVRAADSQRWHVQAGTISCDVTKQAAGTTFRVQTDYCEVEVLGTSFMVQTGECHEVSVREGVVQVHHVTGISKRLTAGERIIADAAGWYEPVIEKDPEPTVEPVGPQPPEPTPVPADTQPDPVSPIRSFTLIDVATGQPVPAHSPLADGATVDLGALGIDAFTIRVDVDQTVVIEQMRFSVNGRMTDDKAERSPPWSVTGNDWVDKDKRETVVWRPWGKRMPRGRVVIEAFAWVDGQALPPATITVTIK